MSRTQALGWAVMDKTDMKPGVAERKWEIDSLCHPARLAHGYWRATGDIEPFDDEWREAMALVVKTFREQQRRGAPGPYRFRRASENPNDTLGGDGYGAPARPVATAARRGSAGAAVPAWRALGRARQRADVDDRVEDEFVVRIADADDRPYFEPEPGLRKLRGRIAQLKIHAVEKASLLGTRRDKQRSELEGV